MDPESVVFSLSSSFSDFGLTIHRHKEAQGDLPTIVGEQTAIVHLALARVFFAFGPESRGRESACVHEGVLPVLLAVPPMFIQNWRWFIVGPGGSAFHPKEQERTALPPCCSPDGKAAARSRPATAIREFFRSWPSYSHLV